MDAGIGVGAGLSTIGSVGVAYGVKQMMDGRAAVRSMQTVPVATNALINSQPHLQGIENILTDVSALTRKAPQNVGSALLHPFRSQQFAREVAATMPAKRIGEGVDHVIAMLNELEHVGATAVTDRPLIPKVITGFTHGGGAAVAGAALLGAGVAVTVGSALDS